MSLISESGDRTTSVPCICCGEVAKHGGFYCGAVELALCSDCVRADNLNCLGILLGDAVFDCYRRNFPKDDISPVTLVDDILLRLRSRMYRAVTRAYYSHNHKKPGRGLT